MVLDAEKMRSLAMRYIEASHEYVGEYETGRLTNDWVKKKRVAEAVVQGFKERAGDPSGKRILEIGFGNGLYAAAFARAGANVSALEVNKDLFEIAIEIIHDEGVSADLKLYDGFRIPYPDGSFEYAYSVSVLEHMDDPFAVMKETARVLKSGGKYFLAFPNRYAPKETHTGIYFLGYLPRRVADLLLRKIWHRTTVDDINLHFVSYWKMKRMLRGTGLRVTMEYSAPTVSRRLFKRTLGMFGIHYSAALRTIMVILEKQA